MYKSDILRPLLDEEIEKMIEIYAKNLPMSGLGYNFLRMNVRLNKMCSDKGAKYDQLIVSDYMRREIYTKRDGILENCTFISISRAKDYSVFMYSNNADELRECLMNTNLIDYSLGPYFISIEKRFRSIVAEVFNARNINIRLDESYTIRILPKAEALKYEYKIPDDVIVEKLRVDDVDLINAFWPHRYPGSLEYLKSLVGVNDSVGIFSLDKRKIRAWAMVNDQFGIGMVHTLPDYRGNGYANIVIKSLSKTIATKYDLDVQIFIFRGNTTAENMFQKLGFMVNSMSADCNWIFTKPLI